MQHSVDISDSDLAQYYHLWCFTLQRLESMWIAFFKFPLKHQNLHKLSWGLYSNSKHATTTELICTDIMIFMIVKCITFQCWHGPGNAGGKQWGPGMHMTRVEHKTEQWNQIGAIYNKTSSKARKVRVKRMITYEIRRPLRWKSTARKRENVVKGAVICE